MKVAHNQDHQDVMEILNFLKHPLDEQKVIARSIERKAEQAHDDHANASEVQERWLRLGYDG